MQQPLYAMNIIIKNTNLLAMTDCKIEKTNIYIKDDQIVHIGNDYKLKIDREIDGSNYITMPGFINAHTHIAMSYFRNYGNDNDLMTWLNDYIFPAEEKLNDEIVYNASLLSMAEMIKSGTTTFADMYFYEESTIKALEKSKMRAQISRGLSSPDEGNERLNENIKLYKDYNGLNGKLEIALGPHAIYTTDLDYLKQISKLAEKYNMPIHTHLSETRIENDQCYQKYGKSPTEIYNECGIFDNRTIAAHGIYLSDKDMEILRDKNVSIIHNPKSNLKLSSGICDVPKLREFGINVGLGTDSASSNNKQSMLAEIEYASLIAKLKGAEKLKAYEVLQMATVNNAKALGIFDKVGSLETGKKADLIMIDIDNINHRPENNLIGSICYSTYESDIKLVMIGGDIVYENGKFKYLDLDQIKEAANELSRLLI